MGASNDRSKFGNKVLRSYAQNGYLVTPINKKQTEIEGLTCTNTLTEWYNDMKLQNKDLNVGVSIVTPPGVTKMVLEEGISLGIKHFYLQPGTYDSETDDFITEKKKTEDINVVRNCVLVQIGFVDE